MLSIIIAILVFSLLIISHEFGHFLFAKRGGIGVTEFSVGMGPRILSRQIGETRYSIKIIPFGGSCAMVGEDEEDPAPNAFNNKSVWTRVKVIIGGPLFNILTAFILSIIIIACAGVNPAKVYKVTDGSAAASAGIRTGDIITSINGHHVFIGRDLDIIQQSYSLKGKDVTVTFKRDGEKMQVTYDPNFSAYRLGISYMADATEATLSEVSEGTPAALAGLAAGDVITALNDYKIHVGSDIQTYFAENPADGSEIKVSYRRAGENYETGITPVLYEGETLGFEAAYGREKAGPLAVIKGAAVETCYWIRYTIFSLKMLVTGGVSARDISGPVGIVSVISSTVDQSKPDGFYYIFLNLLNLAILLSANLGVMNLLPLPALDGGRLIFLILEALRGKPIPPDKEGMVHLVGFGLLMLLMVFVMFNDITRLMGIG